MNAYKKYLLTTTADNFRTIFGDLARNARGWLDLGIEINELSALIHEDMSEAHKMACSMLHGFYNKPVHQNTVEDRQDNVWVKKNLKRIYRRKSINREFYDEFTNDGYVLIAEGEYLIPVIHGGDLGRINAALLHGRGYRTESSMSNPKTKMTDTTGLMFHSKYAGRAHYYARSAAAQRVGIQAVLVAFVPRKYVWRNEDRDEYSLPTWHYDKLVDATVITEMDDEFWNIEEYYTTKFVEVK